MTFDELKALPSAPINPDKRYRAVVGGIQVFECGDDGFEKQILDVPPATYENANYATVVALETAALDTAAKMNQLGVDRVKNDPAVQAASAGRTAIPLGGGSSRDTPR